MSTPRQVLVVAAVCLLAVPAAAADTEVHGEWWTPGFAARVRIEDCAGALCGRIVRLWDEAARAADGRPLVGRQVKTTSLNTAEAAPLRGFGSRSRLRAAPADAGSPFLFGGHARQQLGAELH